MGLIAIQLVVIFVLFLVILVLFFLSCGRSDGKTGTIIDKYLE